GDTTSYVETIEAAQQEARKSHPVGIEEVVMDKGYHSGAVLVDLAARAIRSYVPEPERGKRHWSGKAEQQQCVYANRRRVRADRSKRLQKLRGELCERSFAHCYETGALRRMYVRGTDNVFKRVLVQAAAFNIGLLLRTLSGWSKPRQPQRRFNPLQMLLFAVFAVYDLCRAVWDWLGRFGSQLFPELRATPDWRVGLL
ncbi:MAG: transposase, partial [Acidobacteriota bacterium]|nr:transposase [Acidobacteriota bacterium]